MANKALINTAEKISKEIAPKVAAAMAAGGVSKGSTDYDITEMPEMIKGGTNIMYVEPNLEFAKNGVEMAPDLNDYCIYVNLVARIPIQSKTSISEGKSEKVISMVYVSNTQHEDRVSFNQGTVLSVKGSGKTERYLTTQPYSYGTWSDVYQGPTTECFGINSIDIEYNNFMIPVVTIQFTDIRGISLFAPTEEVYVNQAKNQEDESIASFFQCFFTFPYPQFMLHVKGFYGEPATYHLTVQDFQTSFESSTGNFKVTVKFVGYSGALLSDAIANAVTVAPYTKKGEEWFNSDKGGKYALVGENGESVDMLTLVDFMTKISEMNNEGNKVDPNSELGQEQSENDAETQELKGINDEFDAYLKECEKILRGSDEDKAPVVNSNGHYLARFIGGIIDSGSLNLKLSSSSSLSEKEKNMAEKLFHYSGIKGMKYSDLTQSKKEDVLKKLDENAKKIDAENQKKAEEEAKKQKEEEKKQNTDSGSNKEEDKKTTTKIKAKTDKDKKKADKAEEAKTEESKKEKQEDDNKKQKEEEAKDKPKTPTYSSRNHKITAYWRGITYEKKDGSSSTVGYHIYDLEKDAEILKKKYPNLLERKDKDSKATKVFVYDYEEWYKELESAKGKTSNKAKEIEGQANAQMQEQLVKNIGFKPSIKNITYMVLAHLDILLRLIKEAREEVIASGRGGANFGIDADYVGPFPHLTQQKQREESTVEEDAWIGDLSSGEPEAVLTEDLLEAVKKCAPKIAAAFFGDNSSGGTSSDSSGPSKVSDNVTELDQCFGSTEPYAKTSLTRESFYDLILQREVNVNASIGNCLSTK